MIDPWDEAALLERVAARLAERRPVWDLIAAQARARALETASWSLDRAWPLGRVREAWVVWRHGGQCAAELGPVAGWLESDDPRRLRRAAARYERYVDGRPSGFPEQGLAALTHIAAIAGHRGGSPSTLRYGIRALDQLSRRMRAAATADDTTRLEHAIADFDLTNGRRRAIPAPYPPPAHRRAQLDPADLRLARLTGLALREVQRLDVPLRDQLLAQRDAAAATERLAERDALWQSIARIHTRPSDEPR